MNNLTKCKLDNMFALDKMNKDTEILFSKEHRCFFVIDLEEFLEDSKDINEWTSFKENPSFNSFVKICDSRKISMLYYVVSRVDLTSAVI